MICHLKSAKLKEATKRVTSYSKKHKADKNELLLNLAARFYRKLALVIEPPVILLSYLLK